MESEKPAAKRSLEETLASLPDLLTKRKKDLDKREKELEIAVASFKRECETYGACTADKGNDVLHLNVGGTIVTVSRKTLTMVEGSMLASHFSGRWDDSIAKDRDGNFFIDQSPDLFLPLIDYFREKLSWTPESPSVLSPQQSDFGDSEKKYNAFLRIVQLYGLTPAVYPTVLSVHCGLPDSCEVTGYPDLKVVADEWSVLTLLCNGHKRAIKSFEVKLGDVENMQIGWLHPNNWLKSSNPTVGVGSHAYSVAFDISHSEYRFCGNVTRIFGLPTPGNGDVVRCEKAGSSLMWSVNGSLLPGEVPELSSYFTSYTSWYVPAFSGKGQWSITNVKLN